MRNLISFASKIARDRKKIFTAMYNCKCHDLNNNVYMLKKNPIIKTENSRQPTRAKTSEGQNMKSHCDQTLGTLGKRGKANSRN